MTRSDEAPVRRASEDEVTVPLTAWTSSSDDCLEMAEGLKKRELSPAEWAFARLTRLIEDFEKSLSADEEIGATIVGAPGEGAFHVDDIGFWGPDLILFYGKNAHGRPVRLVQHYAQLSLMLTTLPKERPAPEPKRIGFVLREKLDRVIEKAEVVNG